MIWSLSVTISYNDDSWESAELVKDKGGYRSFGPDVTGLPQLTELFASLNISIRSTPFYRSDVKNVIYRFSALTANGSISVAGGINSFFVTNNLQEVSAALLNDADFVETFIAGNLQPYLFDQDFNATLFPLYFDNDGVRIGSAYRGYGLLSGFESEMARSAFVTDLSGVNWVIGFDFDGLAGLLLKLDDNYNIVESINITGGIGGGNLIDSFEAIKAIAYDQNSFLVIQEDRYAYYLSKTGVLTLADEIFWTIDPPADGNTQPDPLSLFRYNNDIYCLFESTLSVGRWNADLRLFDNVGDLQIDGVTELDILDAVGTYFDEVTGKYKVFINDESNGWRYGLLSMPSLQVEIVGPVYGFDDDIIFAQGPVISNDGIGYGTTTFQYIKRFYNRVDGNITFSLPFSYLKSDTTSADLIVESGYDPGPATELLVNSFSYDSEQGSYLISVVEPEGFDGSELRVSLSSERTTYVYVQWD